jgi:hypothetical protein
MGAQTSIVAHSSCELSMAWALIGGAFAGEELCASAGVAKMAASTPAAPRSTVRIDWGMA